MAERRLWQSTHGLVPSLLALWWMRMDDNRRVVFIRVLNCHRRTECPRICFSLCTDIGKRGIFVAACKNRHFTPEHTPLLLQPVNRSFCWTLYFVISMFATLLSSVHAANLIRFLCEQHFYTTHIFDSNTSLLADDDWAQDRLIDNGQGIASYAQSNATPLQYLSLR